VHAKRGSNKDALTQYRLILRQLQGMGDAEKGKDKESDQRRELEIARVR
jgi:hypothetical protein